MGKRLGVGQRTPRRARDPIKGHEGMCHQRRVGQGHQAWKYTRPRGGRPQTSRGLSDPHLEGKNR